jgi:hypothetical protein
MDNSTFYYTPYSNVRSATVSVSEPTFLLTVLKSGSGSGVVTAAGIDCGSDCTESYNSGETVQLEASPAAGSSISGWAGCDSIPAPSLCNVTMSANRTVTAEFTVNSGPTTINVLPAADNAMIWSSKNSNRENTVFEFSDLAVGCNWEYSYLTQIQDWVCYETALRFDVDSQIAGRTIVQATLRLTPSILAADYQTTYRLSAFASSWSPSTITYTNKPNYYTYYQPSVNVPTSGLPLDWDVTDIVRFWADGTWANNGFFIRDANMFFPYDTVLRATIFHSTDVFDSPSQRPLLMITME